MDKDFLAYLKALHTGAIDARNGYQRALDDAKGRGLTALFEDMISLHQGHARELANALRDVGEGADDEGGVMSVVNRTIMDVRALFGGLGESVLPGLIDGEKRNVARYDEALNSGLAPAGLASQLTKQKSELQQKIAFMETELRTAQSTATGVES